MADSYQTHKTPINKIELAGWGDENGLTLESIAQCGASIKLTIGKESCVMDCNLLLKSVAALASKKEAR